MFASRNLPVFTGKKEDVLNKLRTDFERSVYPRLEEIEKEIVGSLSDGEYPFHVDSSLDLDYTLKAQIIGLSIKWYISTIFQYESTNKDDCGVCYVMVFQNGIMAFTVHSMKRFIERALYYSDQSVDRVFHKYIEPQVEYASNAFDNYVRNTLFLRVDEGAFLSYTILHDGKYWLKTFVHNETMFNSQRALSALLDTVRYFEMDTGFAISSILQPENRSRIFDWVHESAENRQRYVETLWAVQNVISKTDEDLLDDDDLAFLSEIESELNQLSGC